MGKQTTSAHAVWTGFLSFNLLSIPVKLYAAARDAGISFNQVHVCHGPALEPGAEEKRPVSVTKINQQNFCLHCTSVVTHEQLSKGFELDNGQYAVVDPTELKALEPEKSNTISITSFVPLAEVDPIFFEKSYYVTIDPKSPAGRKPYELLFRTMQGTGKAGVAKFISRGKEYNVFVRAYGNGIIIHTLYAEAEVRELPEYNAYRDDVAVSDQEIKLAKQLLEAMTATFEKATLIDSYSVKVAALVASKKDEAVPAGAPRTPRSTEDLIGALSASLYNTKKAAAGADGGNKESKKKVKS